MLSSIDCQNNPPELSKNELMKIHNYSKYHDENSDHASVNKTPSNTDQGHRSFDSCNNQIIIESNQPPITQ